MLDVPPVRLRFFQKAEHQDPGTSHPAEALTLDMILRTTVTSCARGLGSDPPLYRVGHVRFVARASRLR